MQSHRVDLEVPRPLLSKMVWLLAIFFFFGANEYCQLLGTIQGQCHRAGDDSFQHGVSDVGPFQSTKPVTHQEGIGMLLFMVKDENKILVVILREEDQ